MTRLATAVVGPTLASLSLVLQLGAVGQLVGALTSSTWGELVSPPLPLPPGAAAAPTPPGGTTAAPSRSASATAGVVLVDVVTPQGEGAGTGMVLTSDGMVLTNYHVVEGSTLVRVTVADTGETYTATVVGRDADADVALLRLTGASGLATVRLDHDGVEVGDRVVAIGNGRGTGTLQTVEGSVRALAQDIDVADESSPGATHALTGLIETDAPIVPGYSGGPLFDAEGEVVGINAAGATGRIVDSYAIPIGTALAIVDVIEGGTSQGSTRVGPAAALGVSVLPTQQASRRVLAGQGGGVSVVDVDPAGGAAAAGMGAGSVIIAVDGAPTRTTAALAAALAPRAPGDVVTVAWVDADGAARSARVQLGASPVN